MKIIKKTKMNSYYLKHIMFAVIITLALIVVPQLLISQVKASDVYFCGTDIICIDMYELLPQDQLDILFQAPYMIVFDVDEELGYLHMEIDATQLGGITPQEIGEYLDNLEFILRVHRAQTTIYPDTTPAPICMRDSQDGGLNGIYNSGSSLVVLQDDPRCFGVCDIICQEARNGGINENIAIN